MLLLIIIGLFLVADFVGEVYGGKPGIAGRALESFVDLGSRAGDRSEGLS